MRLLRTERLGLRPRLARVLLAVDTAGRRHHIYLAKLRQSFRGHRRTHPSGAVEDRHLALVGEPFLSPLLEIALRDVRRADDVTLVPFVLLPDVPELDVAGPQQLVHLLRRRFLDALFEFREVLAVRWHSALP